MASSLTRSWARRCCKGCGWLSFAFAVPLNRPWTESYFSMYAIYSASRKGSLMPTIFALGLFKAARKTKRPIRPKPLIPIFVTMLSPLRLTPASVQRPCDGAPRGHLDRLYAPHLLAVITDRAVG